MRSKILTRSVNWLYANSLPVMFHCHRDEAANKTFSGTYFDAHGLFYYIYLSV